MPTACGSSFARSTAGRAGRVHDGLGRVAMARPPAPVPRLAARGRARGDRAVPAARRRAGAQLGCCRRPQPEA
eukprot:9409420-Lingulodinium_polyedra.AAC.1